MREIISTWETDSATGGTTVMYFDEDISAATQVTAVNNFWIAVSSELSTAVSVQVANTGRLIAEVTGTLTGVWSGGVSQNITGDATAPVINDASQVLVRWRTGDIVGGRFVQGRTFIPGLAVDRLLNGNLSDDSRNQFLTSALALAAGVNGMVVWSRPTVDRPGSANPVVGATVWDELAVLRSRRG